MCSDYCTQTKCSYISPYGQYSRAISNIALTPFSETTGKEKSEGDTFLISKHYCFSK
jgi:hypothetical protein